MKLDLSNFTKNIILEIDRKRCYLVDPQQGDEAEQLFESRINAFYRMLGLPAYSSQPKQFDKYNNGNLFKVDLERDSERLVKMSTASTRNETHESAKLDENNLAQFMRLDYNSVVKLSSGIRSAGGDYSWIRKKGSLFPMVVDGTRGVFPVSKRVAPAFVTEKELRIATSGKETYQRPLLESIILLRLRGDGVSDALRDSVLLDDFVEQYLEKQKDNPNLLSLEIIDRITTFIFGDRGVVEYTKKLLNSIAIVKTKISTYFDNTDNTIQQPIFRAQDGTGNLEKQIAGVESMAGEANVRLSMFDYSDTAEGQSLRNLRDTAGVSWVVDLASGSDEDAINRRKEELARVNKKAIVELKNNFRKLDELLGTFNGLSGVDVLIILLALFLIEEKYLVGLLNKDAQDRLNKIKGGAGISGTDDITAVEALQEKVKELYTTLDAKIEENTIEPETQQRDNK